MPKTRVLVVDDAVVVRSRISKIIDQDPDLEVVGAAANGRIALAKIPQVNPDVVILDVEMPELNGLETLAAIRQTYRTLPVIMFSSFTEQGAVATLEALALGATDYATKPNLSGDVEAANRHIWDELIPKIKLFGAGAANSPPLHVDAAAVTIPTPRWVAKQAIEVVAIGVSTGGPNALAIVLSQLPADFPVPIVIVQHMPPMFTKLLAERLNSKSHLKVNEAISGMGLEPGQVWIAPGDFHLSLERDADGVKMITHQAPPENSCRPSVDVLFRSVADIYQERALAVILTGMGQDGLRGCQCIREAGGQILAQDEASSVVWGMPRLVIAEGLADLVVPIDRVAAEIVSRVAKRRNFL